jgi:hypothetical protein
MALGTVIPVWAREAFVAYTGNMAFTAITDSCMMITTAGLAARQNKVL